MAVMNKLKLATDKFFTLHWNDNEITETIPEWSDSWYLVGAMPYHDKQGVYAFIEKNHITYIGVGAGKGKAGYERHGLGARISNYIRLNEDGDGYDRNHKKIEDTEYIVTLGFPGGYGYIAASLEQYLIGEFEPRDNLNKAGT